MQRTKGYDPEPLDVPPIFQSPSRPVAMVKWLVTKFMWPQSLMSSLMRPANRPQLPHLAGPVLLAGYFAEHAPGQDQRRLGLDLLIARPQLAKIERSEAERSLRLLAEEIWPAVTAA